jgi:Asp-tRNA(Asn)/Glu-tRNA(Gln) amidotransferase A subunit family amidase
VPDQSRTNKKQPQTNCLTELLYDEAIARAKHLDSLPEPKGMLFGLPISTKEHHGTISGLGKPITTNASTVSWIGKHHSAPLLYQSFWDEGCVFYARTTQPQTIMHLETESNVYGLTVNPYNRNLTPGGSSGGEGALIGMRGSLVVRFLQSSCTSSILTQAGNRRRHRRQRSMPSSSLRHLRFQVSKNTQLHNTSSIEPI